MNATPKSSPCRFATAPYALCAIALAVVLSACGGGGGGTTTPPATDLPTVTVTSTTAGTLRSDGSHDVTYNVVVTGAIQAPTAVVSTICDTRTATMSAASLSLTGSTVAARPTLGYYPGEMCESTLQVNVVGVGTATAASSVKASFIYKPIYEKETVGISSSRLAKITESGPVMATLMWVHGVAFHCLQGEAPVAADNGWYKGLCQGTTGGELYAVKWDVAHNVIYDWTGPLPAGYELTKVTATTFTWGPKWHHCMNFCSVPWGTPPNSTWYSWADAKDNGVYFTEAGKERTLSRRYTDGTKSAIYSTNDGTDAASSMLTISSR